MDDKHKDSYIKIEDLHAWLVEHKDQIDWVNLRWTWSPNYIDCETNYVADGGDYDGFSVYAVFESMMIDDEYSYAGDIEGAIKFAEGYRCWNGKEFTLKCGIILEGEHDAYNADCRYREEDMDSEEWLDLSFVRLAICIDGKQHPYKGLIRRRERCPSPTNAPCARVPCASAAWIPCGAKGANWDGTSR